LIARCNVYRNSAMAVIPYPFVQQVILARLARSCRIRPGRLSYLFSQLGKWSIIRALDGIFAPLFRSPQ